MSSFYFMKLAEKLLYMSFRETYKSLTEKQLFFSPTASLTHKTSMNALPCIRHLSIREGIRVHAAFLNHKVKIFGIKYTVTASSFIGALFPTWSQCWNTATRTVKTPCV